MLNASRKKIAWFMLAALALLMLAGTPLITTPVLAGDCPGTSTGTCP